MDGPDSPRTAYGRQCLLARRLVERGVRFVELSCLLDSTRVVWAGKFGRTPFAQDSDGRDHNPYGFTIWMAGGGVKPRHIYGATDDVGYHAIENPCTVYNMWATMLHLMGD